MPPSEWTSRGERALEDNYHSGRSSDTQYMHALTETQVTKAAKGGISRDRDQVQAPDGVSVPFHVRQQYKFRRREQHGLLFSFPRKDFCYPENHDDEDNNCAILRGGRTSAYERGGRS